MSEVKHPERDVESPERERAARGLDSHADKRADFSANLDSQKPNNAQRDAGARSAEKQESPAGREADKADSKEASAEKEKPEKEPTKAERQAQHSGNLDAAKLNNEGREGIYRNNDVSDVKNPEACGKFDRNSFPAEKSYDANASQQIRDSAKKANSELVPMGGDTNVARESQAQYTPQEKNDLKSERERVDAPKENTVMQKVIGPDTGKPEQDLSAYLNPTDRKTGEPKAADAYGFVSKAEDAAPFTQTPKECYDNLRLDYPNTDYKNPEQPVYVMRFTDGTNYEVPYSEDFGGHNKDAQPCTGNGYIGGDKHLIPEYKVAPENSHGAVITDGTIYRVHPDGTEEAAATFNKKDKCFDLV